MPLFAALNAELVAKDKENKHTSYVSGKINCFASKFTNKSLDESQKEDYVYAVLQVPE